MTRDELIKHLKENTRVLQTPELEVAFRATDRADFVREDYQSEAYEDYPLPIGFGQTISQPTTVAFMLELLDVKPGHRVLDVGSGSGWTTALLSVLVGEKGEVIGLERVPELVEYGRKNLAKYHFNNVRIGQAGGKLGIPGETFDRILVSAGAERLQNELIAELRPLGKMVIPVGDPSGFGLQIVTLAEKTVNGKLKTREYPGFAFVPLVT